MTATASTGATAAITANGTAVESGSSVSWQSGTNSVVIVVTEGAASKTYTVTVTKEA